MKLKKLRKIVAILWILFLVCCLGFIISYTAELTPTGIAKTIAQFNGSLLAIYSVMSLLRGFTLIPSTPFVLAGAILFPQSPYEVLLISMIGIICSSSLIYYFSDLLGFSDFINKLHSSKIENIQRKLEKPTGFLIVFVWSFLPYLPTDLVCYLAGTLRMNFARFIFALFLGELILCSFYIFFSKYSFELIRQII